MLSQILEMKSQGDS